MTVSSPARPAWRLHSLLIAFLTTLALAVGLLAPAAPAAAQPSPAGRLVTVGLAVGYTPNNYTTLANNLVRYTHASGNPAFPDKFAVFQTHNPWGSTVVLNAITGNGYTYDLLPVTALPTTTFTNYRVVVLNFDDTDINAFLASYQAALPALQAYMAAGGVVWIQAAVQPSGETTMPLPFGGTLTFQRANTNYIVDPTSPIVAGVSNPINGSFASHAHFTGLPTGAHVIVTETNASGPATLYELVVTPAADVSPASINFGNQQVGTTSATQTVTVTSAGMNPLIVTGVALAGANPGDFRIVSDNCTGQTVPLGNSCTVLVAFAPTAVNARGAQLVINDNAPDSPQSVALSGNGTAAPPAPAPIVNLAPTSLTFGNQQLGTSSASQSVTVTNTGSAPLTITVVTITGANTADFAITSNTCVGAIASGASCTVSVNFTPTAATARGANLTFTDNAADSPQQVALSGNGVTPPPPPAPAVTVSPASLAFGSQQVGASSAPQTVTLTNNGSAPLTVSSVSLTGTNPGDFAITSNTCVGAIASGASCTVSVSFTPTATGSRRADLTFTDNASTSPQRVALSGEGTAVPPPVAGWSRWNALGGLLTDAPAATGFNGRVYVFAKGSDNALYLKSSADGVVWTDWSYQGGILTDAPAAASHNGVLYVFAKGSDNALYVKTSLDGTTFSDWRRLGGVLTAPPAATSFNGQLYVFARGANTGSAQTPVYPLWVMASTDGVTFGPWQHQGGNLTAAPAVTTHGGRLYIFARGIQVGNVPNPVYPGQPNPPIYPLYVKSSANGSEFSAWTSLGGNLMAAPAAASYVAPDGQETLYVFANGTDRALYERHSTDGVTYTDWISLGGDLVGPPAAAGVNGRVYAFVRWLDNTLWEIHTTP